MYANAQTGFAQAGRLCTKLLRVKHVRSETSTGSDPTKATMYAPT